jgi:hypothetical protein
MKHTLKGNWETREVWLDGKCLLPERSQRFWNHSPDGFNWGYYGSGPAQLALAVMLEINNKPNGYQVLKEEVIARLPHNNFEIEFEI